MLMDRTFKLLVEKKFCRVEKVREERESLSLL